MMERQTSYLEDTKARRDASAIPELMWKYDTRS